MILLPDRKSFDPERLQATLSSQYNISMNDISGDDEALIFNISNETVAIGFMPIPIPGGEIERTAEYAYNWPTAIEDLGDYKSHLIVSILESNSDQLVRYKILTIVISTLLQITNASGVYLGNQSLLIPTNDYLAESETMNNDNLPLSLWVYFGIRPGQEKNSVYTYGLTEFGRSEIEIIDSLLAIEDLLNFIYSITHYLLGNNVRFEHGHTIGFSEDQKIKIILTKGKFVAGETFKLLY